MEFKNRFLYAIRALRTNRLCSVISVIGLGLGLACTIVITKYIHQEYTTDQFHRNYSRIYACFSQSSEISLPTLSDAGNWRKSILDYPEVESTVEMELHEQKDLTWDKHIYKTDVLATDTNLSRVFDFSMLSGDMVKLLSDPGNMIVTEQFAQKVFGRKFPIGEDVEYFGFPYKIAGVIEDCPVNSSFTFDVIVPIRPDFSKMGARFIVLKKGCDIKTVNEKLAEEKFGGVQKFTYHYKPFAGLYFNPAIDCRVIPTIRQGNEKTLAVLIIISVIILVISVFNYVNMYHVALLKRYKELGVKKVYGVSGRILFAGFWMENFVMVGVATLLALVLVLVSGGMMEAWVGVPIRINAGFDLGLLVGIVVVLPFLTSVWPYARCCRVKPVLSMKSSPEERNFFSVRRILLVGQYVMTTVLIIVSFYFMKQLDFMLHRDIGLKKENIIHTVLFSESIRPISLPRGASREDWEKAREKVEEMQKVRDQKVQFVENELQNNPAIQFFCAGESPLKNFQYPWKYTKQSQDYRSCSSLSVTPGFEQLYGLKIKEGRFFDRLMDEDREDKVVINEAARKFFGIESLDDAYLANNYWGQERKPWKVIGVVEDFYFEHLSKSVQPLVMFFFDDKEEVPYKMHITKGKEQEVIAFLGQLYKKINPDGDFVWHFFEEELEAQYAEDEKIIRIFSIFSILAVFISSMGLFGFAVFDTRQRYREIGIRKVNGAATEHVVMLLTGRFFILVAVAFVIACPIAFIAIKEYMKNFAEQAALSWWLFAGVALMIGILVFITLFWQSYKAATTNPVEVLKNE